MCLGSLQHLKRAQQMRQRLKVQINHIKELCKHKETQITRTDLMAKKPFYINASVVAVKLL